MPSKSKLLIRKLDKADLSTFKEVRFESLKNYPENFTSSYEQEKACDDAFFLDMLEHNIYYGCFKEGKLIGLCGFMPLDDREKTAHKGVVTGFYIRKDYRGRGFAKKLMGSMLAEVSKIYKQVTIRVNSKNSGIHKLYRNMGFNDIGREKRSLKVGDRYVDEFIMVQHFD